MDKRLFALAVFCALLSSTPMLAHASDVVVGVDFVFAPYKLPPAQQETILDQMQRAGVRAVRCSLSSDDAGIDFAQRVYAHGIKIIWMVGLTPAEGTPWPHAPQGFKGLWQGYPLSSIDPARFRAQFQPVLARLEEKNIVFAAFEPGNEINWAGFNADFSLPGEGRVLGKDELQDDSEGRRVAKGFLQYLKLLAALKDIRGHSRLNQRTPIISAGLADVGGSTWPHQRRADAVDISATLDFMRQNGLDKLVDGYGLHSYPPSKNPNTSEGAAARRRHIEENGIEECRPEGSSVGKPCWITEWGAGPDSKTCPVDDSNREKVVRELRGYYNELARQGRLKGLIYCVWHGPWNASPESTAAAWRCGSLTESGKLAIAPM
jgi:hypothetical protein